MISLMWQFMYCGYNMKYLFHKHKYGFILSHKELKKCKKIEITGILKAAKVFKQGSEKNEICVLKLSLWLQYGKQIDSRQVYVCVGRGGGGAGGR